MKVRLLSAFYGYGIVIEADIHCLYLYRHDRPTDPDDPLADQNMKDRFYGQNDPVAAKLLNRYSQMPKIAPPEDKSITTLYVGNIGDDITENEIK